MGDTNAVFWGDVTSKQAYDLEKIIASAVKRGGASSIDGAIQTAITTLIPGYSGLGPGVPGFPPNGDIAARADVHAKRFGLPLLSPIPVSPPPDPMIIRPLQKIKGPTPWQEWEKTRYALALSISQAETMQWRNSVFNSNLRYNPYAWPAWYWDLSFAQKMGFLKIRSQAIATAQRAPQQRMAKAITGPNPFPKTAPNVVPPTIFYDMSQPSMDDEPWGNLPPDPNDYFFKPAPEMPEMPELPNQTLDPFIS